MREIIVDRENGAKAFVLFELTKGNIAEIKDRYILEQLRSAIDSPWSTALPDGIRSALTRSVSEEMEDRFLLENMDKDTDRSVRNAIRSAVIKVKGQHGVKNGPWADAYGDADVLDYAYQEIITRFSDGPGALLDEIEIPEGYRIISGEKWASDLSGIGREWIDDIKPFLLLADKTGELMICDIMSKQTVPVVAVRSDFAERFDRLVSKWKVYAKLGMPGWYSLVPIFSDRKLYENVRGNKENKTLVMAYLIISLLTIAQLATIIIFLNNLVQIFV